MIFPIFRRAQLSLLSRNVTDSTRHLLLRRAPCSPSHRIQHLHWIRESLKPNSDRRLNRVGEGARCQYGSSLRWLPQLSITKIINPTSAIAFGTPIPSQGSVPESTGVWLPTENPEFPNFQSAGGGLIRRPPRMVCGGRRQRSAVKPAPALPSSTNCEI